MINTISQQFNKQNIKQLIKYTFVILTAVWAYWPTLRGLVHTWDTDPNYSQGYLIPLMSLGLLWYRVRENRPPVLPDLRLGVPVLSVAAVIRALGAYFFITPLDHISLLLTLAGLCLLFGGRRWLGRVWPALAILVFTCPMPASVVALNPTGVLQTMATRGSNFVLQTLGVVAARDGNVILLKGCELGVVEACSGLRMLMVFCSLAFVSAVVLPIDAVRKAVLVASAVPLAVACNVTRITVAGLASDHLGSETGHFVFHDLAGWFMVPLAFGMFTVETLLLIKLVRPRPQPETAPAVGQPSALPSTSPSAAVAPGEPEYKSRAGIEDAPPQLV